MSLPKSALTKPEEQLPDEQLEGASGGVDFDQLRKENLESNAARLDELRRENLEMN